MPILAILRCGIARQSEPAGSSRRSGRINRPARWAAANLFAASMTDVARVNPSRDAEIFGPLDDGPSVAEHGHVEVRVGQRESQQERVLTDLCAARQLPGQGLELDPQPFRRRDLNSVAAAENGRL